MGHRTRQETLWVYLVFNREEHTKCSALDIAIQNPCKTFPEGKWACLSSGAENSTVGEAISYFDVKREFNSYANAKGYYLGMIDKGICGLEKRVYNGAGFEGDYDTTLWQACGTTDEVFLPDLAKFPTSKEADTLRETTLPKNLLTLNP